MTRAYYASILASSTLFLFYGIACLSFEGMKRDFERFGLSRLRSLTGTLEVLGALGLIVGEDAGPSAAGLRRGHASSKSNSGGPTVTLPARNLPMSSPAVMRQTLPLARPGEAG